MPDREQSSEMSRADYWENAAAVWHDKYKEILHFEISARRYEAVFEEMAKGRYSAERCRQMAIKALTNKTV